MTYKFTVITGILLITSSHCLNQNAYQESFTILIKSVYYMLLKLNKKASSNYTVVRGILNYRVNSVPVQYKSTLSISTTCKKALDKKL